MSELPFELSNRTKLDLELHYRVCENKGFSTIITLSEDTKILESILIIQQATFFIYADLECLIEKTDGCKNNPENSFIKKVSEHIT